MSDEPRDGNPGDGDAVATADRSVRLAWAADASAIASIQVAVWRQDHADQLSGRLDEVGVDEIADQWRQAVSRPSDARQRVLVALERASVRGFTTTSPSTDGDADAALDAALGDLVVRPDARTRGHASRLLHAAVDTMRSDGFARATTWVGASDQVLRDFLVAQGWALDGAHRELDLDGDRRIVVTQVRLHTALDD